MPLKGTIFVDEELTYLCVTSGGVEYHISVDQPFRELTTDEAMIYQQEVIIVENTMLVPTEKALKFEPHLIKEEAL